MKKLTLLLVIVGIIAASACRKKGEKPEGASFSAETLTDTTEIEFVTPAIHDFDTVNEGQKVEVSYQIKNLGPKNLIIVNAIGSCGCTVPEWPKEPVKPGEIATIDVVFNSEGKPNEQTKTVSLICNSPARHETLVLKGFVNPKK